MMIKTTPHSSPTVEAVNDDFLKTEHTYRIY